MVVLLRTNTFTKSSTNSKPNDDDDDDEMINDIATVAESLEMNACKIV